jgi:hypothetical protein
MGQEMKLYLPLTVAVSVVGSLQAQTPKFVPGEVMVRFAQGSEASVALNRVVETDPTDLAGLLPTVTALGAGAGVPLRPTRVGSGGWVILAIDSAALAQRLHGQLPQRENVESVRRGEGTLELVVRFRAGSAESDAIAQQLELESDDPLTEILCSLERETGVPLTGEAMSQNELALQLDLRALTLSVVSRLQALSEIEAAQPNYVLRRMGVPPRSGGA